VILPRTPRWVDLLVAALGLSLLWPLLALLALLIRLESPGSPVFRQVRVGRDGRPFRVYKLRTMRQHAPATAAPRGDFAAFLFTPVHDRRRTPLGAVLRSTSMDEAPQLLNVLRGEMALVGPRPEIPEIVAAYAPAHHTRHRVRPGLTGLAQIHGRADLALGRILAYDLAYARRPSARLDVIILFRTVGSVLRREGAR
jgi:lipopolysaccharide/colanic/teichoic acid biosynthesis glycosyltransferase